MKATGGEIIVKKLIQEEVPYVIGIPGHGVLGLFDAIRKADEAGKIRYLQVKHEQAATAIADGYYRACGKPLAVFASIGPGTLNLSIGLATAYVDSTPFLALCGDTHTNMYGVGVLQEVERYHDSNIQRALEPLVKRCWRAETADQLPRIANNAFNGTTTLRSITIPSTITAMGDSAFYKCSTLAEVHISSIESWCNINLTGYYSTPTYYARNLFLNDEEITELVVPDGVTEIKDLMIFGYY